MLGGTIALELLTPQETVDFDISRCVRSRYRHSACHRCVAACPQQAIYCDPLPRIDVSRCRGCRLCESACPTGALHGSCGRLGEWLGELDSHHQGIWGCSRHNNVAGHVQSSCLGFLSSELLLGVAALLPKGVTFNLSRCIQCPNGHAAVALQERIIHLEQLNAYPFIGRLRLAWGEEQLNYRPKALSRRAFFQSFRHSTTNTLRHALNRVTSEGKVQMYGAKRLPAGRDLLLQVLPLLVAPFRSTVAEHFFPAMKFADSCRNCRGCIGICPTGALTRTENSTKPVPPSFHQEKCTACCLCVEFCRTRALEIQTVTHLEHLNLPVAVD
jgi:ferredoxin